MKYILCLFIVVTTNLMSLYGENFPHLILYFDINKTLIASDKASNKSVEDVLNELLAEKYEACWDQSLDEMTFDAYVNKILLPGPSDQQELRNQRRFYLQHFIDYLREQNHPLYAIALHDYEALSTILNTSNSIVFPSFYLLLDDLDRKGISYSIVLRSFGEEIFDVMNEINAHYKMMINQTGKFREGKLLLEGNDVLEDSYAIYHQLRRIEHAAIHDDWNYWNAHSMSTKQGKPFYLDREDSNTISIFFDDNIREDDSTQNIIAPLNATSGELISIGEVIESGQAVRVETMEAILNVNYYINCVEEALYRHSVKNHKKTHSPEISLSSGF